MTAYSSLKMEKGRRHVAVVYIAGDYNMALEAMRLWCDEHPDCWCVERADYVFTGGQEAGVKLMRIDYPRFPLPSAGDLQALAEKVGVWMIEHLHQSSCTVVGPISSTYLTRHPSGR